MSDIAKADLYGVVAKFGTVEAIKEAAQKTRDAGYENIEAYTPFAIEGLDEDLGHSPTRLGLLRKAEDPTVKRMVGGRISHTLLY